MLRRDHRAIRISAALLVFLLVPPTSIAAGQAGVPASERVCLLDRYLEAIRIGGTQEEWAELRQSLADVGELPEEALSDPLTQLGPEQFETLHVLARDCTEGEFNALRQLAGAESAAEIASALATASTPVDPCDGDPTATGCPLAGLLNPAEDEPWIAGFETGLQAQQDYDEAGASSGFSAQNAFGRFFVEGLVGSERRFHLGLDLVFSQTPVQQLEPSQESDDQFNSRLPDGFNDIDDAVTASAFLFREMDWARPDDGASALGIGPVARIGFSTRKELRQTGTTEDGAPQFETDSIVLWGGVGLRMRLADQATTNDAVRTIGLDRLQAEFLITRWEDFAGKDNELRYVPIFRYRLLGERPLYFSAAGNFGSGEDIFSIGFSYVFTPEKLFGLF